MRGRPVLPALLLLVLLLAGCGGTTPPRRSLDDVARFPRDGDYDLGLDVGGHHRTFILHVPRRFKRWRSLGVVVAFHGGASSAGEFKAYADLDRLSDREGFVVVYPDGSGPGWRGRRLLTWNAGGCCGWAREHDVDDVGFVRAILADLARDLPLDRTRVYATGHSNGAMMAYRLATEVPERIAAITAVAGMMQTDHFPPARPVPVLHIHSVDDPRALYAGGVGPAFPFTFARVVHLPVEATLQRWVEVDGCPPTPQVVDRRVAPVRGGGKDHTATLLAWAPCTSGAEVRLWKLTGAGHGWPGGASSFPEAIMGPDTNVIGASVEAWDFFSRFRRPDAPPLR